SADAPKNRFWYFVNRFLAGVGSFLVVYAISRTSPELVQAISGVRYAIVVPGRLPDRSSTDKSGRHRSGDCGLGDFRAARRHRRAVTAAVGLTCLFSACKDCS